MSFCVGMTARHLLSLLAISLPGCVAVADPSECTGDGCGGVLETCKDVRYGDGTCDLHLECAVPDIDCYRSFASDTEAAAWWTTTQTAAGQSFPVLPTSDPRFAPVRDALDRGWDAFKANRPVGKLADLRPALVIVDKPLEFGAFVYGDQKANQQPFVVMVETAVLGPGGGGDPMLGVMMHELQHAVGLHKLGDVSARLRTYYVAPVDGEPAGRDQVDDPAARAPGEAWRAAAAQVGPYSDAELGGLPFAGGLFQMLSSVAASAVQGHPAECTDVVQQLAALQAAVTGTRDPLDDSITTDLAPLAPQIDGALTAMRDQCLADFPYDVIAVGASIAQVTPQQFEAALDPHDVALVKGKHFIDGLTALVGDRRAAMRDAEAGFVTATGQPWTQLRYFSYEEDADDVSAMVMAAAHRAPTGMAAFLRSVLGDPAGPLCDARVADGLPGYGVDLTDEHHATCWRIAHVQRDATARFSARVQPVQATAPVQIRTPGAIPNRPSLADQLAY